jgi:hypothetical protein
MKKIIHEEDKVLKIIDVVFLIIVLVGNKVNFVIFEFNQMII